MQIVNETIPALQKLKEQGLVKFIGITGYPLDIYTYVLDRQAVYTIMLWFSPCIAFTDNRNVHLFDMCVNSVQGPSRCC